MECRDLERQVSPSDKISSRLWEVTGFRVLGTPTGMPKALVIWVRGYPKHGDTQEMRHRKWLSIRHGSGRLRFDSLLNHQYRIYNWRERASLPSLSHLQTSMFSRLPFAVKKSVDQSLSTFTDLTPVSAFYSFKWKGSQFQMQPIFLRQCQVLTVSKKLL